MALKRREGRQLGISWSQTHFRSLLMAKRAIVGNGSASTGLFELCCAKKGRELRKKSI